MLRSKKNVQDDAEPRALLRAAGLRATSVRLRVYDVLRRWGDKAPMTAQEIVERLAADGFRDADRVTVYRSLNSFVETGLAHKLDPGDRVFRFAALDPKRPDTAGPSASTPQTAASGRSHEHPHFVCDECGTVECLDDAKVVVNAGPRAGTTAGRAFRVRTQEVVLHGTCGECETPASVPTRKSASVDAPPGGRDVGVGAARVQSDGVRRSHAGSAVDHHRSHQRVSQ